MEKKLTQLTEEEFYDMFEIQKNHIDNNAAFGGCMYETFSNEVEYVRAMAKENRVITIIESDDCDDVEVDEDGNEYPKACMYYASGFHIVNRIGYFILDKPYEFDFEVKIDW